MPPRRTLLALAAEIAAPAMASADSERGALPPTIASSEIYAEADADTRKAIGDAVAEARSSVFTDDLTSASLDRDGDDLVFRFLRGPKVDGDQIAVWVGSDSNRQFRIRDGRIVARWSERYHSQVAAASPLQALQATPTMRAWLR